MDLETLLRIPYVHPYTRFDISSDGTSVAFSWNPTGQWEIFLVPVNGSAPPRQITTGAGAKFCPRWSPDGRRLAYALDLNGDERFDIYACDLDTDRHTNLTPDTTDAIQHNFCWSPDGSQIAFISDRSGHFDTYVTDVVSDPLAVPRAGPPRLVLSLPHPDWEVYWSPDGRWLAVIMEAVAQDFWTAIVPAEGGESRIIASSASNSGHDAASPIRAEGACWSPDSTRIAFSSDLDGFLNLGIYELATEQIAWVTEGSGYKKQPAWSPEGRRLAYVAGNGPVAALAVLELDNGPPTVYQVEPGVCGQPRFTPDGTHLIFLFSSPRHPNSLWALSLKDGSFQQLTHSPGEENLSAPVMPTQVRSTPVRMGKACRPSCTSRPRRKNHPRPSSASTAALTG